jgi:hypothetical protein
VTGGSQRWGRDDAPLQAILTDAYLDALLAGNDRHASDAPSDAGLDPRIRATTARLRTDLVRFHPSFRFEERVAARLAELAAQLRLPAAAGAEGIPLPAPIPFRRSPDPDLAAIAAGRLDPSAPDAATLPRTVLIGGAMASAVISLAGVVFVAWRATRPQNSRRPDDRFAGRS